MSHEIHFKVGVFTVTFMEAPEDAPRPWDDFSCECEEFAQKQGSPFVQTIQEKKCRHVREAEMYAHYADKVEPIDE